jgi:hypothetical protein
MATSAHSQFKPQKAPHDSSGTSDAKFNCGTVQQSHLEALEAWACLLSSMMLQCLTVDDPLSTSSLKVEVPGGLVLSKSVRACRQGQGQSKAKRHLGMMKGPVAGNPTLSQGRHGHIFVISA